MKRLRRRYGRARGPRPGSAAYVGQLAAGINQTMRLIEKAERGDKRALAALRRRLKWRSR